MDTRRRIDLCTCGKPRVHPIHGSKVEYGQQLFTPETGVHAFMPNPQPVVLARTPPPVPDPFHRITAVRVGGKWSVEVYGSGKIGQGFAQKWLDAVNAAIEDLKEKT